MEHDPSDDETIKAMLSDKTKGSWDGDTFTPKMSAMAEIEPMNLVTYFRTVEKDRKLFMP